MKIKACLKGAIERPYLDLSNNNIQGWKSKAYKK